jgi:two-component system OmpR family sensor kinase
MHASFDRWWNGISLRAKITGVTVLLLTFGVVVAGAGTVSVLRGYLMDQTDSKVDSLYSSAANLPLSTVSDCSVTYGPNGTLFAVLHSNGSLSCSNVPSTRSAPETSQLTVAWATTLDEQAEGTTLPKTTIADKTGTSHWRVIAFPLQLSDDSFVVIVVGQSIDDVDSTVGRFMLIFFGFALAVVVFGAATTQLLVTSTFAPLRDVEATAARFAAGDYSQRLGGATPNTEVGRLNRSLNTMLARIDRAFADRQRALEQMRRFVGDASHELRTPLVSLRGYAELYRMGAITSPEDVAQAMDRIEREAIRMGGLVEDLLELARLDESKPLRLEPVDLLPIAQDAALDATASNPLRVITVVVPEPAAPEPPDDAQAAEPAPAPEPAAAPLAAITTTGTISLTGALSRLRRRRPRAASAPVPESRPIPDVGPIVLAEGDKIRQVITNLIGNAMRFTPPDSPIELAVEVDRAGDFGQISVIDHGEGIPPQLREKIFQRFWRADTSRTRDTGGSGLGLAIVAGIVANHHGHVEVVETPGGGATFRVSLPLFHPEAAAAESSTDATPRPVEGTARS